MGLDGTLQAPVAAYPPLISPNAGSFKYAISTLVLQAELLTSFPLLLKLALVTRRILILAAITERKICGSEIAWAGRNVYRCGLCCAQ